MWLALTVVCCDSIFLLHRKSVYLFPRPLEFVGALVRTYIMHPYGLRAMRINDALQLGGGGGGGGSACACCSYTTSSSCSSALRPTSINNTNARSSRFSRSLVACICDGVCFDSTADFSLGVSSHKEAWLDGRAPLSLADALLLSALASTCVTLTSAVLCWCCTAVVTIAQARLCGSKPYS